MIEIGEGTELAARCGGDTLCLWVGQGLGGRGRAWRSADGRAVAVAGPGVAARDRLAVRGPAGAAVALAREVLDLVGPGFRPLGDPALIGALVAADPRLEMVGRFGWMSCRRPEAALPPGPVRAAWLSGAALAEAAALIQEAFPDSLARPGIPGAERWAGVRDDVGGLVATGTLAWPAPAVGLLAGIAVRPRARGRGLGRDICAFLLAEALRRHEAAALMVDDWNHAALWLYRSLGLRYRAVAAAAGPG